MQIYDGIADNMGFCKATRNRWLIHAQGRGMRKNGKDPYELPKQAWKDDVDLTAKVLIVANAY